MMIKHNLKIGYRNLIRKRWHSLINIGGLSVGMMVAMLVGLWVNDELSFNKHHQNYDQIAQVMQTQTVNGIKFTQESIPMPLDGALRTKYGSDFKFLVMSSWLFNNFLSVGQNNISKNGAFMDVDAPYLLSLNMRTGSLDGLKEPGSILLALSTAKALFGDTDPINKSLKINNSLEVVVTGVYEDLPYNSRFRDLNFIAPWKLYISSEPWIKDAFDNPRWDNNSFQLFAQIPDHADMELVSHKIERVKYDNLTESDKVFDAKIFLHPMKDWHLRSNWENGVKTGGLIQYVWLFGTVGIFVLLLACINFMNLSTAQSEKRSKEVGVRKSIGSSRNELIIQFMSESFIVVKLAFLITIVIVSLVLSSFNLLADKQISIPFEEPNFWMASLGFVLLTGFLAGSYPALYLSSFNPVKVLKGTFNMGWSAVILRKGLVTLQFVVSVVLIIGTIAVEKQVQHSKDRPIGYEENGVIMIEMNTPDHYGKFEVLRTELKQQNAIIEMAQSSSSLIEVNNENGGFSWDGKDPGFFPQFATIWITHDYGKTIGWEVTDGRDLSSDFTTDSTALILNESAVKYTGIAQPIGEVITWGDAEYTVIGVIKDILMESPFRSVQPTVYMINSHPDHVSFMELKLNPGKSAASSLALIEGVFKNMLPDIPFEYTFADDGHAQKFAAVERIGKLSGIFAILAIFISCLGLFGLASFMAEKRTKEIGIRKVLGASVIGIWQLLSKEFVALVMLSCLISIPISYYVIRAWLQNYEYRTDIEWWVFASAGIITLIITMTTISYQALGAALANPVTSLHSE